MIDKFLEKISSFFSKFWASCKERNRRGLEWIGMDGLVCMETSALLVIFFMLFCPVVWAMTISFLLVTGKSVLDDRRGKDDEFHDLVCCVLGVIFGVILGMVHAAVVVL